MVTIVNPKTGQSRTFRRPQPARVRALLVAGWILEEEALLLAENPRDPFAGVIPGITPDLEGALYGLGLTSYEDLQTATDATLRSIHGLGQGRLKAIREFCQ